MAQLVCWSQEADDISDESKAPMNRLMCSDPTKRLGSNAEEKYAYEGEEIRAYPWPTRCHQTPSATRLFNEWFVRLQLRARLDIFDWDNS